MQYIFIINLFGDINVDRKFDYKLKPKMTIYFCDGGSNRKVNSDCVNPPK